VEPDELDQVFDAKVAERLNTIFADAIDPLAALYTAFATCRFRLSANYSHRSTYRESGRLNNPPPALVTSNVVLKSGPCDQGYQKWQVSHIGDRVTL